MLVRYSCRFIVFLGGVMGLLVAPTPCGAELLSSTRLCQCGCDSKSPLCFICAVPFSPPADDVHTFPRVSISPYFKRSGQSVNLS